MPWITPSTKATGEDVRFSDWVDALVDIAALAYEPTDGTACGLGALTTAWAEGSGTLPLFPIPRYEGLSGYDTVGAKAWSSTKPHEFIVPKGYSGIWKFIISPGWLVDLPNSFVTCLWTLNSTVNSSGMVQLTTGNAGSSYAWTYRWAVSQSPNSTAGTRVTNGAIVDKFSSGDEIRVWVVQRPALWGHLGGHFRSRFFAQFLGTTA